MKTLVIVIIISCFALTTWAQVKQDSTKNKPKATYQVGAAFVKVWENKNPDGSTWKNFKVEKRYKKGEEWKTSNSFNQAELLELKAAIDKAISEESVKTK